MSSDVRGAHEKAAAERSVRELVTDLTAQLSRLIRTEIRLAKHELAQRGKKAGAGLGVLVFGAVLGLLGGATLVATAVLSLALVLPAWASALIVGGLLVVLAAVLAGAGLVLLRRQAPPLPQETIGHARQDIDILKHAVSNGHATSREPERR